MSERSIRPKAETRTALLLGSLVVSALLFRGSQVHAFPDLDEPFNLNEHAKHIGGGLVLSFGVRYVMENIKRAREWAFATAVSVTTAAGFAFESPYLDIPWYRDTTLDYKDAGYMAAFSVYGALCMKNVAEVEAETPVVIETNPLQTD
ncbi:MAG: hypothetical protein AAB624_01220 [Patescibacteria group bacterium]